MDILELIAKNTYLISDLKRRIRVLREYLEKKIFGGKGENKFKEEDQKWLETVKAQAENFFTPKTFYKQSEDLTKKIDKLTPLTVYLAFALPEDQISKITETLRADLKSNLIFLDIKTDPDLIGGAAFVYKGVYKDLSLRKKLEDQKDKILEEMKRYIN